MFAKGFIIIVCKSCLLFQYLLKPAGHLFQAGLKLDQWKQKITNELFVEFALALLGKRHVNNP